MTHTTLEEVPLPATHVQLAEIISLRDYMAMAALPGLINVQVPGEGLASVAYQIADMMLAEKAKHENKA